MLSIYCIMLCTSHYVPQLPETTHNHHPPEKPNLLGRRLTYHGQETGSSPLPITRGR